MKNSLVSVFISTYNRKKYIAKAIGSVLSQTFKDIEIIIIDNGSTDGTYEFIFELSKKYNNIIPLRNEINSGQAGAANKGISLARGKYIAILDDDDYWCDSEKLEKQVGFLEKNKEYVLVGGGVIKINNEGKEIVRFLLPEKDKDIRKVILTSNVFAHSTVLYVKDSWKKAGGYQENLNCLDWDLWLKLGKLGKFYNFQEFFACYLDQGQNSSRIKHDYQIRRKLIANIKLKNKYKNYYSGYKKALLVSFVSYFYSFIPFREKLWPMLFDLRNLILGPSPYKYFKPSKK